MKVALLQILPTGSAEDNYQKASLYIKEAAESGADIAILPECWNTGYSSPEEYPDGQKGWREDAISQGSEDFKKYCQIAKNNEIALAFAYLEADEDKIYNSVAQIDRFGQVILNYRKVHTVRKNWEQKIQSGNEFFVADLHIKNDIVKIGAMICYDREFPEAARILMHKGAEIILVPNACFIETNRLSQLRSRAFENMVGMVTVNYPSPKENGHSSVYDGLRIKGEDYNSEIIVADETEGLFYAYFDIEKLRKYRSREIWGDSYRKPWLYQDLIDDDKADPFLRKNAEKK